MRTCTHRPESMPRQYVRVGVMLVGVGFVVATGLAIEGAPILVDKGKKIARRAVRWAGLWIRELWPGPRDYV